MRHHVQRFVLPIVTMLFMVVPLSASAASVADLIRTPDEEIVTRGDFIRAVVKALNFPAPARGIQLPYKRPLPPSLLPTMTVAHEHDALEIFGQELLPSKGITRGEALVVIVKLRGGKAANDDTGFTDVRRGSPYAEAVEIAVGEGWLEPVKEDVYGVTRGLLGREARVLLRKIAGEQMMEIDDEVTEPKITVRLRGKTTRLPKEEVLEYMWQLIEENYVHQEKIDREKIAEKIAQALADSLEDPYTTYMPPAPAQNFQSQLGQGKPITGIGAQVEFKNNILTIVAPMPGSPAEKAKLRAGDEIIAVDGQSIIGLDFNESVSKVRGPKGTTAKLRVRRDGSEMDIDVVRDVITVTDFVVTEQNGIPVVRFSQFGEMADRELRQTFATLNEKKPKGIVVDLRNNPGGLLHTANVFLSNFLPMGSVTSVIKSNDGDKTEVTEEEPTVDPSVKIVLIVNRGSASAAELVSAALQDYERATVVGETTFGKGSVQRFWDFSDGSIFKLTVAEYQSPDKRRVDGVGVKPDILVASADIADRDEAMLKALEIAGAGR